MTVWPAKRARIRPKVLKRDNYTCQKCLWKPNIDNISKLHIHHIDGKHDDHSLENLKTLCIHCHGKEKIHRPWALN